MPDRFRHEPVSSICPACRDDLLATIETSERAGAAVHCPHRLTLAVAKAHNGTVESWTLWSPLTAEESRQLVGETARDLATQLKSLGGMPRKH